MGEKPTILTLTDYNFEEEVLKSALPVIVMFESEWSGHAHIMAPILKEIASDYHEKIKVGKLNFENNKEIPFIYGIGESLTLLFIKKGQVMGKFMSAISRSDLDRHIKELLLV